MKSLKFFCRSLLLGASTFLWAAERLPQAVGEFGVCGHPQRWEWSAAEQVFPAAAELGATRYRFDFDWNLIEPQQGRWDFAIFDDCLARAEKSGIQVLPIIGYHTPWATPGHRYRKEFLNYVEAVVRRYGERLPVLELWNEPDHKRNWQSAPSGREYGELLKDVYARVKKVNPKIQVAISGPATAHSISPAYLEEVLATGRGCYDELFIHPYNWWEIPENHLAPRLRAIRALMEKYGASDVPLSISEVGYPSAPQMSYVAQTLDRLLVELGTSQEKVQFTVIEDLHYESEGPAFRIKNYFPRYRGRTEAVTLADVAELASSPDRVLVIGPREDFPAEGVEPLVAFVRKGGKVLFAGAFPLYTERSFGSCGEMHYREVAGEKMKLLHVAYYACWLRKDVPQRLTGLIPPAPQEEQRELYGAYRFFGTANCRGRDRFVSVVEGLGKDFGGTLAGVYHLDSDLKGKVAVNGVTTFENVTELEQAELLPRTILIALGNGVRTLYWYSSRSTEERKFYREGHFGLRRKDFTVKPAGFAYQTLASLRPAGSSPVRMAVDNGIWSAHWVQPQGDEVLAVWCPKGAKEVQIGGRIRRVVALDGKAQIVQRKLAVSPAIQYVVGSQLKAVAEKKIGTEKKYAQKVHDNCNKIHF